MSHNDHATQPTTLQITPDTVRGKPGFVITGQDWTGRRIRVFTHGDAAEALTIADDIRAALEPHILGIGA